MNKKIVSTVVSILMILGSTSIPAFASMSNGTVVVGSKAFDLNYANNPTNVQEISDVVVEGGEVYVKDFSGNWINNITGLAVTANLVPAVVYTSATGKINYDAADKDQVNSLVALGDSITYGMSAAKGYGYVDLYYNNLKSLPENDGIKLMNMGIPGEESSDLLSNLKNDEITKNAVSSAKDITICVGGNNLLSPVINDLATTFNLQPSSTTFSSDLEAALVNPNNLQKLNTIMSGLPSELSTGVKQFSTDWTGIIATVKSLAPKANIYVTTVYNPIDKLDPLYNTFDQAIKQINTTISTSNTGYKVADIYTAFKDYTGTEPLTDFNLFTGNLDPHPTTKGHEVIYQSIIGAK
jgi:lysophospholipase L1-like esterase